MLEKEPHETLGKYIERLRKLKGYSQRKLALVTGLSNTTISRIESGETEKPDVESLKLIARHLDIDEVYILKAAGYIDDSSEAEKQSNTTLSKRDLKDIEKDLEKMIDEFQTNPDSGFAAYNGEDINEDDMELLKNAFKTALMTVKKINKEKYNPRKYKK